MLIIEASNIYFRGGFVLLEQILDYCEEKSISATVYLGYPEVYKHVSEKGYKNIQLRKTNGIQTILRYWQRRSNVLFFCNLPPFVRNKKSVIYAHNILFFESPNPVKGQSVIFNIKKFVYFYWIKFFAKNVDIVACQTEAVKNSLLKNLHVKSELFPFYRIVTPVESPKLYDFCNVGSAAPHKNIPRLLEAVDRLSAKYDFTLALTVEDSEDNKDVIARIKEINSKYNRAVVINKGLLPYEKVGEVYSASKALIFPSQAETIALPLIEGLQYGLKILSSDLPFTHQVVENPIVFNPESVDEIAEVMEKQLNWQFETIVQKNKIPNKLPELINAVL